MDMTMNTPPKFWDDLARKYAAQPIADPDAYARTLDRTRGLLPPDAHVLELGCGTGGSARALAPDCARITATDYAPEMIAIAKERGKDIPNVQFEVQDIRLTGLPDAQFDAVLAYNLMHLVDLETTLTRVHAVLKPGGLFISKTPCLAGAWYLRPVIGLMRLAGKAPELFYLSTEGLDAAHRAAGFEVIASEEHNAQTRGHFIAARKI